MKLGKLIGRFGFAYGILGSLVFYSSQPSSLFYESHVACPACPYVDIAFATRLTWIQVGLGFGLVPGLAYAVLGFAIGCSISKALVWHRQR
jgi:hypothetical protein